MDGDGRIAVGDVPAPAVRQATLSLNFNGTGSATAVGGIAGADGVAAGNWNNLGGGLGSVDGDALILDSGEGASGVQLEWGANLDAGGGALSSDTHSQIASGDDGDLNLYEGYLYTTQGNTLGVDVSGLSALFDSYEVYVYLDADNRNSGRGESIIQVNAGGESRYVDDAQGNTFQGVYQEAAATDPAAATSGNYVRFTGLTDDLLELRLDAFSSGRATRPMISGIQIVGTVAGSGTTAPATTAQALLDTAALSPSGTIALPEEEITSRLFDDLSGGFSGLIGDTDAATADGWITDPSAQPAGGVIAW